MSGRNITVFILKLPNNVLEESELCRCMRNVFADHLQFASGSCRRTWASCSALFIASSVVTGAWKVRILDPIGQLSRRTCNGDGALLRTAPNSVMMYVCTSTNEVRKQLASNIQIYQRNKSQVTVFPRFSTLSYKGTSRTFFLIK